MPQQYVNLEEAAQKLGLSREELIQKVQRREIRGFADRGTWKFRLRDIEEYARQQGIGSGAEIVLGEQQPEQPSPDQVQIGSEQAQAAEVLPSDSDVRLVPEEPAEQPSDSDVKLVGEQKPPSDSDVKLVDEQKPPSDSDVKLAGEQKPPSDSDVKLVDEQKPPSDSDVRLAPESETALSDSDLKVAGPAPSDSDVRLEEPEPPTDMGTKLSSDSSTPETSAATEATQELPVLPDEELEGSSDELILPGSSSELTPTTELDSDFELNLEAAGDSADEVALLPEEDQVELAPVEEEAADVTAKQPGASGIDLASPADSGIALESQPEVPGAQAAGEAAVEEPAAASDEELEVLPEEQTEFEPGEVDSDFELSPESSSDTAQLTFDSDFELAGAEFDSGAESDSGEVLELAEAEPADESAETQLSGSEEPGAAVLELEGEEAGEEVATRLVEAEEEEWAEELEAELGEGEEVAVAEELEAAEEAEAAAPAAPAPVARAPAQPPWGAGWVITLGFCAVVMLLGTAVMIDLVRTMWGWPEGTTLYSSPLLNALASIWQ